MPSSTECVSRLRKSMIVRAYEIVVTSVVKEKESKRRDKHYVQNLTPSMHISIEHRYVGAQARR